MEDLKKELKRRIIKLLQLKNVTVDDINDDDPLLGDDMKFDSIDAIELAILLNEKYGIEIKGMEEYGDAFNSINKLAEYISVRRSK